MAAKRETSYEPRTDGVTEPAVFVHYDHKADILHLYAGEGPRPSVAHYVRDGLYQLLDLQTSELIGYQVDDWDQVFLARHPEVGELWFRTDLYRRTLNPLERLGLDLEETLDRVFAALRLRRNARLDTAYYSSASVMQALAQSCR